MLTVEELIELLSRERKDAIVAVSGDRTYSMWKVESVAAVRIYAPATSPYVDFCDDVRVTGGAKHAVVLGG